jgi:hypothetical protein
MPKGSEIREVYRDPEYVDEREAEVEFRLTYDGPLLATSQNNTRTKHKHEIRKRLHPQLKRLWMTVPHLTTLKIFPKVFPGGLISPAVGPFPGPYRWEIIAEKFAMFGYNFVPLVAEDLTVNCAIEILMLRPDFPGAIINRSDIDNRLKTLFDAMQIPRSGEGLEAPTESEKPFFCLLEDDKLISKITVETDSLLQPIGDADEVKATDVRLVITVRIRPYIPSYDNLALG